MSVTEAPLKRDATDASVHLDAIRGLAALAVFLGHARSMFLSAHHDSVSHGAGTVKTVAASSHNWTPSTVGHEAVIVFFVLSGYWVGGAMLRAMRQDRFSWSGYGFQRLTRLWIPLIPALVLTWCLDSAGIHIFDSAHNLYSAPAGQDEVAKGVADRLSAWPIIANVVFLQGIRAPTLGSNTALWSLSYEAWYYFMAPLLLIAALGVKGKLWRVIAGAGLLACLVFVGPLISAYFLMWLLGLAAATIQIRLPAKAVTPVVAGFGVVFVGCFVGALKIPAPILLSDAVIAAAFTALVWSMLQMKGLTVPAWYRWPAERLGRMSYTLYLTHTPVLVFCSALLMPVWGRVPPTPRNLVMVGAVVVGTFAISALMYLLFERNTDWVRRRLMRA